MFNKFSNVFNLMIESSIELPTGIVLPEATFTEYFKACCDNTLVMDIEVAPRNMKPYAFSINYKGKKINFLNDKAAYREGAK